MPQLLSEMLKERDQQTEIELPETYPNITDWVIYVWADTLIGSKEVPMIMKVTSGDPERGLVAGWAMTDPALEFKDAAGIAVQTPPLIPIKSAAYSSTPQKHHWLHISDFRDYQIALIKGMSEKQEKTT
jgi:hypothetical protein